MDCCSVFILIAIVFGLIMLGITASEENKKEAERQEREENARRAKRNSLKSQLDSQWNTLRTLDRQFSTAIIEFFSSQAGSYNSKYNDLIGIRNNMQNTIKQMRETNRELKNVNPTDDQEAKIAQAENEMITSARNTAEKFKAFGEKVYTLPAVKMMDPQNYGRINKANMYFQRCA